MKPLATLIIACYNQHAMVQKTLYSLQNQTFKQFEIIIADDGSNDEFQTMISSFMQVSLHPIMHVRHNDEGFRKTIIVNEAVRHATTDYLIFIDGDCLLHRKFIERHYKLRQKNTVQSGRRVMLDEYISNSIELKDITSHTFQKPSYWWNHCDIKDRKRGIYIPFIYTLLNVATKDYWTFGSNFSIHRSDFYKVNGYDETIVGRGMEDINLSQRFKLIGFKTKRLTYEAIQYHQFHRSNPVPHNQEESENIRNPKKYWAEKGLV